MSAGLADELDAIADLVNRMTIVRIEPERFHVQRDQIAKKLRRLAERSRAEAKNGGRPTTTWRPS